MSTSATSATAPGEQAWCSRRAIRTALRKHRAFPERLSGPVPEEGAVIRRGATRDRVDEMLVDERVGICATHVNATQMKEGTASGYRRKRYRALRNVTWDVHGRVQSTLRSGYRDRITLGLLLSPFARKACQLKINRVDGIDDSQFAPYRKNHWSALALFTSPDWGHGTALVAACAGGGWRRRTY